MARNESEISYRVRRLLFERDISAAELARRLGKTQSFVARRLNGRTEWRASDLALIARDLGVPASTLMPDEVPASAA